MRRKLVLLVALLIVAVGCWFAWNWFRTSASVVFDSITVGDSEEQLVDALNRSGITFSKRQDEGTTVYFHSDGFVGVYFYFVENGRVISKAAD